MPANVMTISLGTRGSQLALAQTELVKQALERIPDHPEVIVTVIKTKGDQRMDLKLTESGQAFDKGLFTKELEDAILRGEVDVAVHALKDLPTELASGLELVAVLPRHDPVDVLVAKTAGGLSGLPVGARVATSSLRRARQLAFHRPDVQIVDVRGNVGTRLSKLLHEDSWSAIVLAKAGLQRLGFRLENGQMEYESQGLFASDLVEILPAVGQGAIGLEISADRGPLRDLLSQINDPGTWFCTAVEREFLRLLKGGCQTPIGIRSRIHGSELHLEAVVFDRNGRARSGAVFGAFQTSQAAAAALVDKVYGNGR
jgi:hydroxymethylbilane synthase